MMKIGFSAHGTCHILWMKTKKRNRLEIAKKIISNVKREMQKPRLTASVRNDEKGEVSPIVERSLSILRENKL